MDEKKSFITHLPKTTAPPATWQRAICGQLVERRHILRPNDLRPLRCLTCIRIRDCDERAKAQAGVTAGAKSTPPQRGLDK